MLNKSAQKSITEYAQNEKLCPNEGQLVLRVQFKTCPNEITAGADAAVEVSKLHNIKLLL